jgi:hypothetical protein
MFYVASSPPHTALCENERLARSGFRPVGLWLKIVACRMIALGTSCRIALGVRSRAVMYRKGLDGE